MRIWAKRHCNTCDKKTHHNFNKREKMINGYPEERYFEYICVQCDNITNTVHTKKVRDTKSPDFGATECQVEFMNQARYNGENFRNWITLVDQMRNNRENS